MEGGKHARNEFELIRILKLYAPRSLSKLPVVFAPGRKFIIEAGKNGPYGTRGSIYRNTGPQGSLGTLGHIDVIRDQIKNQEHACIRGRGLRRERRTHVQD